MRSTRAAAAALLALAWAASGCGPGRGGDSPHKVYVMLGFHSNFYHSWRGDTPDEAGFGTDIRLARFILDELDRANREGLSARGYWDHDNLFTLETILPVHAPDIPERIRRRVQAGLDEVVLGAYANGLTGAMTPRELRATVDWAVHNPWGSGTRDVFGSYTPVFRPQEDMLSTGAIPILQASGVEAVVLSYSEWPFNAFSNFVPVLPPEQRYGATWLRLRPGGPRIRLLPAMSIGDVLNHISMERWMLDLRELQLRGGVERDLLLHMNFDTDVESWMPQDLPPGLGWFPNAGGLREYIEAVNKYPWAEFTTPAEYLTRHDPVGEVVIRQDTADGAFDGHASWAEKFPSHGTWTDLEGSRLAGDRAEAWLSVLGERAGALAEAVRKRLWEGRDSSFFRRLRGLSTTHFGMSTPALNEERQATARRVAAGARRVAESAERSAAGAAAAALFQAPAPSQTLARIAAVDVRAPGGEPALSLLRLPFVFADGRLPGTRLRDEGGGELPHSWLNLERLGDALAAELWVWLRFHPGQLRTLRLERADGEDAFEAVQAPAPAQLANSRIQLELGGAGVASLRLDDWQVGGPEFLAPFLSYRVGDAGDPPHTFTAEPFEPVPLPGERREAVSRTRLITRIPFSTPEGPAAAALRVDLTLPDGSPWIVADVEVDYPYTAKRDLLHTTQQKLRRYIDLRWVEVGPFPLTPRLEGTRGHPLTVWKHNFLNVTSSYPLDYGRINSRNAELDAFNHQITAGWVALSDGQHGLLVADRADVGTSFAFAPMRLRERGGRQVVSINPFGSYHGRQLAYDHLGGNGVGTEFTTLGSSAVRPNGPSYNGERERFSLLLAPYAGDAPPESLRADAGAFFRPPAVVIADAQGMRLPADLRADVEARRLALARQRSGPLPTPRALLANPSDGAVDLVWDAPRDPRIDGFEIEWRPEDVETWQRQAVERVDRQRVGGLTNGRRYAFRLRATADAQASDWTQLAATRVGPVPVVDAASAAGDAPIGLLLRTFWYGLVHAWTTP